MSEHRQRVCTYFQNTGRCRYGDACRYSHSSPSLRQAAGFQERVWSHGQASTSHEHPLLANVRIMSYNILADQLAHEHAHELYRACPRWCLQWQHRGPAILAEIEHWAPDIGCLQEVDHPEQFHAFLQQLGYETAYAARTGDRCDGCLTFWRRGRFTALQSESLQMRSFGLKDNVALLVLLAPVLAAPQGLAPAVPHPSAPALLIGNTHLLFNPNRGDIKAGQARTILTRMHDIQSAAGRPSWSVLMGDFNSVPGSPIYSFVRSGALDCSLVDRRNMSGQLNSKSSGWPPRDPRGCGWSQQNGVTSQNYPPVEGCVTGTPVGSSPASGQSMAIGIPQQQLQVLTHSSSVPSIARGTSHIPHQASRAQSIGTSGASAPPLYSHLDANGRVFWSPLPPSGDETQQSVPQHHPFYYEPMLVEEAAPVLDAAARLAKSASVNARMTSMATWGKEQLDMAVGPRAAELDAASVGVGRRSKSGRHVPSSSGDSSSIDLGAWVALHPLGTLHSAYAQVLGSEPAFTSCHGRVIATLDYMWYTRLLHVPSPAARPGPPPHRASADTAPLSQTTSVRSWVAAAVAEIVGSHPDASTSSALESHSHVSAHGKGEEVTNRRKGDDSCISEGQPHGRSGSQSTPEPSQQGNCAGSDAGSASAASSGAPGGLRSDEWELVPMRVAMVPPLRSLRCGLPAPEYPSDHISLVADFSVRSLRPAPGVPVPGIVVPGAAAVMSAATSANAMSAATSASAPNSLHDRPQQHIYFDE